MKEIIPRLYLGNSFDAVTFPRDKEANIVAVVNTTWEVPNYYEKEGVEYLKLYINEMSPLTDNVYKMVVKFINRYRKKGGVIVHCNAGMQRSPSIIILYLVGIGYDFNKAYEIVRCKAGYIMPPDKMLDFIRGVDKEKKTRK